MRYYLSIVLLLCVHYVARGQTTFDYEYWFDNDRSMLHTGTSSTGAWQMEVDLDELTYSFHTIHLQVRNSKGDLSSPVSRHFIKVPPTANKLIGHYWFDNAPSTMRTSNVVNGTFDIDVSGMSEGYHTFHYQAIDNLGNASSVVTALVYKMVYKGDVKTFRCWFDDDYSTLQGNLPATEVAMLDVSQLTDGFHVVHVQADGVTPTAAHSYYFIKQPQTKGVEYITLVCTIDDELYKQERVANTGGAMLWDFDISNLKQGLHRIQVLGVTPSGAATSSYSTFFMRATTQAELEKMKFYYYIDNDNFTVHEGSYTNGGFHLGLDVSQLTDGLHRLAYFMSDGKGSMTKVTSQFFWKTPVGGNGITEYKYWLNDKSNEEDVQVVKLAERTNPYQLVSLLPVSQQPIRSSCFEFRIKDNLPVIYAKNDVHIRFTEATGRFTDVTKQFVDESVKQEISTEQLESGVQATTAKPEANAIKWYCLEAEPGDSLQFKLDRAASIQLFAPSGKEVYSVSGAESVNWGGLHVSETGTYYLALHDVTATYGNTVSINYNHIDKYAVLRQDVALVGNGGCSTITFEGNGFRDLYAIDLYNAKGDTIKHVYIGHESDATTSVVFDFTGAEIGKYHAVFHFTTENKKFTNLVTVEEAKDIELATTVTYPSTFLRGTSTTYTIKITNKGNMTAYDVPLYAYIYSPSISSISHVSIQGLALSRLYDAYANFDEWTAGEISEFKQWSDKIGEDHYFVKQKSIDEQSGDSVIVRNGVFFLEIAPETTKTIIITIASSDNVEALFAISKEWESMHHIKNVTRRVPRRSGFRDWFCCNHEKIECITNLVSNAADIAGMFPMLPYSTAIGVAGCLSGLINNISEVSSEIYCSDEAPKYKPGNQLKDIAKGISWYSWILSCLNNFVPSKTAQSVISQLCAVGDLPSTMQSLLGVSGSCRNAWSKKDPNCPPNPPGGGSSTPQPPSDPNDIYGYLSDAGSKFIADSVAKVNYTIEFENDTTFAKASAHTIVIKDTLDSRYFDLQSFLPTSIKLGSRETFIDEAEVMAKSGKTSFLKTIDMRPEINAIAQVEGTYSQKTGIAEWRFTSLDPMTMEQTDDLMQGILPVNYDGTSGIGEVMYEIGVKPNKADGTEIPNRAGIVFDYEDAIMTPTWTNIVDATAPKSRITDVAVQTDSTATVSIEASDELSGVWRYDVYVQYGTGSAWFKAAENVPADTTATVKIYEGINHGFYVVATDSAGNVERKEAMRELSLNLSTIIRGDANCDQAVDVADVVAIVNKILGEPNEPFVEAAADVNSDGKIDVDDVVAVVNIILDSGQQNVREMMRVLKACGFRF